MKFFVRHTMSTDWQNPENLEFLSPEEMRSRLLEAQEFNVRVNTLSELSLKIDAAQSREEILAVLKEDLKRLLEGESAFLCLLSQNRTHYIVHALSPLMDAIEIDHKHFAVDVGMPGWAIENKAAIIVDIASAPSFHPSLEGKLKDLGISSLVIVPVRTWDDVIGVMVFGSSKGGAFSDPDLWLAQLLSLQIAIALRHTGMMEKAQKRLAQIGLVNQIAGKLTTALDVDELLSAASEAIQRNFNYFDVTIFSVEKDTKDMILAAHAGNYIDFLPHGYRQQLGRGIIGWVAEHGQPVLANDVTLDPRYMAYQYHNTNSELALPILINNEVVGVLNVEDTRLHAFDETDVLVLETLCDQIGSAMRNAKLFDEIKRSNQRLLELDKLKTDFVGIVSHDFRTPLSTIMLAAKSLLRKEDTLKPERLREYLGIIVDQAGKLSTLAEDTLSIAKIEAGQLNYQFKIVNVESVIQEALTMVKISSRHTFTSTVDLNCSYVRGDQNKLRQVLQNLISNAVKYSPAGGAITVTVVSHDQQPDEVLFSVSDQGLGIPTEYMGKLFQKYSRVDAGEAVKIKGTGLGLWICREIIKAHGGRIWVDSEVGKGSSFRFSLKRGN
ncbi:MAG: GAF domain-containing protein [Ignavibacteriales bacterium]|nr:GAF domain-containing protein [Ignavibacteriales bacterium]